MWTKRLAGAGIIAFAAFGILTPLSYAGDCAPVVDVDGDGEVDQDDLLAVLGEWGGPGSADFNDDGVVDIEDLLTLIGCWGETFPTEPTVALATNLGEVRPWGALVFSDIMKQSWATWFTTDADGGGEFDTGYGELMVDENGWPSVTIPWDPDGGGPVEPQILHTLMARDTFWGAGGPFAGYDTEDAERYPVGDYMVTFEGDGVVEMGGSGSGTVVMSGPGPHVFTVIDPRNSGIKLEIVESSGSDPIRNIQVRLPGYSFDDSENTYGPFVDEFVEILADYDVVRYMYWARANNHECYNGVADPKMPDCEQTWSGRARMAHRTQSTGKGVAPGYMMHLANYAGFDPWFVIPHAANDIYIEQFANLAAQILEPDKKVYVEYSNEVWNPLYDQHHFAAYSGEEIAEFAAHGWYVRRSNQVACKFKNVADFTDDQIELIISSQFNNEWLGNKLMEYVDDPAINTNDCTPVDKLGIGPYFADDDEHQVQDGDTVQELFDKVMKSIQQGRFHIRSLAYQEIADQWGVELLAYEGGHHLVWEIDSSPIQDTMAELTRSEMVKDLYFAAFAEWSANTNGAMYNFATLSDRYSRSNFFGHREYVHQELYVTDADGLRPYKAEAAHEIATGQAP